MNLLLVTALTLAPAISDPVKLSDCRSAYDQRTKQDKAVFSTKCFQQWLSENPNAEPENVHAATRDLFLSLAWNYTHQIDVTVKREMVSSGLKYSRARIAEDVTAGEGYYWKSVFDVFDCRLRDGSNGVPRCFLNKKDLVIDQLFSAMKYDPQVHGYGPNRVYGIIMREMPKLVGGNKYISEKYLKVSYEKDPSFSINHLEYARTLIGVKKNLEARRVLELFLNNDCRTMDPKRVFECEEDRMTAQFILQELYR